MRPEFEAFLARLYTDAPFRRRFLANPRTEAARQGMTREECEALERMGLELSARTFAHKRALKAGRQQGERWWRALWPWRHHILRARKNAR